ncbi:hypothetical protein H7X65_00210 [Candidatus Parcubacteria bacterium]|nr:hypothetical protein [Candidatus Parcubacteria bacterium]
MLIFKCTFPYNELTALRKHLPENDFCIITHPDEKIYYGIIKADLHSKFMDMLSGETLEQLEYLDEKELRYSVKNENFDVIGNEELLKRFLGS